MGKCKVKSAIISRFKSFQVFSTQKPGIHRSHRDVDDGNGGTLTSTKYLNIANWYAELNFFCLATFPPVSDEVDARATPSGCNVC